ncbi:MAG TPA: 50S ribosomal protein L25, partial [Candidatus Saccharimonadales bacterium]|nr:50S ribosomal protein L25 [Candidatus Saccharimonadales bacterium]
MKKHMLAATKREIFGKKLKSLRREGQLPGNVYGKGVESLAVQISMKEFRDLYKEVGATGLVELTIAGDTKRPVLIHNVAMDHIKQLPLHADFYQVNLKEKVVTMVPVVITGEPKAVADKLGQLLQTLSEVEVEALPADLPGEFTVDVTELAELDAQITVADLKKPQGVEVLS